MHVNPFPWLTRAIVVHSRSEWSGSAAKGARVNHKKVAPAAKLVASRRKRRKRRTRRRNKEKEEEQQEENDSPNTNFTASNSPAVTRLTF